MKTLAAKLVDGFREDLYKILAEDGRSIVRICESAGQCESGVYLFLKRQRSDLMMSTVLKLANEMGYRVTFTKGEQ